MLHTQITFALAIVLVIALPFAARADYTTIPAGAELEVRLDEPIDSSTASPGDIFRAEVTNSIKTAGEVVIPRGTPARVEVVVDDRLTPGDAKVLAIKLHSIQLDSSWYRVTTGFAELESSLWKVRSGTLKDVPVGTTDVDMILAAPPHGENAALATVQGASVTFHVLHGPELKADAGITVYFTLAELLSVRPEERIR